MQEQLAAAQENLKSQTVDASAGGGMVKVTVNGEMELVNLTIDPMPSIPRTSICCRT